MARTEMGIGTPTPRVFFHKDVILKALLVHVVQGCDSKVVTGVDSLQWSPVDWWRAEKEGFSGVGR